MIFSQLTNLPIIFQVDEDVFDRPDYFLERNRMAFQNVVVVSGSSYSFEIGQRILKNKDWGFFKILDNSSSEVERLKTHCGKNNTDLIISVGGGKVLDVVKRVCYLINLNHLSVPTIISNDGLISPIAVIKNNSGKTESIPGAMPMGVLIDLSIIKESPKRFLRAAAGDILSNLSASNDWVLSHRATNEYINDIAFLLSRSAANSLVYFGNKKLKYKPFLRQIIQGQINSGIAMSLAGSSRPCSGSEHLLSHAIDFLDFSKGVLHGTQVASCSLFALYLQGKLQEEYISYAKKTGLPINFTDIMVENDEKALREVFRTSKKMRPGRYTVLDTVSEDEFLTKLVDFENGISS